MRRCAQNPMQSEFSLCGDAFDAYDSGDAAEPYVIAEPGKTVNCPDCCRVISEIKATRHNLAPRSDQLRERDLVRASKPDFNGALK